MINLDKVTESDILHLLQKIDISVLILQREVDKKLNKNQSTLNKVHKQLNEINIHYDDEKLMEIMYYLKNNYTKSLDSALELIKVMNDDYDKNDRK